MTEGGVMSDPYEIDDFGDGPDDDADQDFGFTEEDCGRWTDGRLGVQCRLAGTEDCDWECPIGLATRSDRRD